ncbi:MAG: alpha/beta hydrolase [Streptococcaceae bacterium]|jgi:uncharacterized alpha/beta hydrolase family protein|nr:alpha/beta hydrolase [Streptococcaceae bacterium]
MRTSRQSKRLTGKRLSHIFVGIAILCLVFFAGMLLGLPKHEKVTPKVMRLAITPTLYVTGSSGQVDPINQMMAKLLPITSVPAKEGLTFIVNTEAGMRLSVSGKIDADNRYPIIKVGMTKGTSNGETYSKALYAVVSYLAAHYEVKSMNFLGYSSGGTGVMTYLVDHGTDLALPMVDTFISLDGEYNMETPLQPGETLGDVLSNGPEKITPMYQYIAQRISRMNAHIRVVLLEGDWNSSLQTDSAVPWADDFSIYPLLIKNRNPVSLCLYPTTTRHGKDTTNDYVVNFVKKTLYSAEH